MRLLIEKFHQRSGFGSGPRPGCRTFFCLVLNIFGQMAPKGYCEAPYKISVCVVISSPSLLSDVRGAYGCIPVDACHSMENYLTDQSLRR